MIKRGVVAGSLLLAAGCLTGPTPSPLLVSSNSTRYVLGAPIELLATNVSDRPLFVYSCMFPEEFEGGEWQDDPHFMCNSTAHFIRLSPGATDTTAMTWVGLLLGPGTYRIPVSYSTDSSFANSRGSVSNRFAVVQ